MFRRFFTFVLAIGLAFSAAGAALAQQSKGLKDNLAFGNPDGATTDAAKTPNKFLMDKELFALSYNESSGTPNWVSWRLVDDDISDLKRKDNFHADPDLGPVKLKAVEPDDYEGSGFDQGHMCPNGDRDVNRKSADKTFVMTNMAPQSPVLNEISWKTLEGHCQSLAADGKELYIICGPLGSGGHGRVKKKVPNGPGKSKFTTTNVFKKSIADGKVTVPAQCWKVILILDAGKGNPVNRVTKDTEVIAVIMANDLEPKKWQQHQVSIADVEDATKFKFFDKLKPDIRKALRDRPAPHVWRFDPSGPSLARNLTDPFAFAPRQRHALLR